MNIFNLLLILIFIAAMTIYRLPKSKTPFTESERPKFVHSLEELRYNCSVVKTFVEINFNYLLVSLSQRYLIDIIDVLIAHRKFLPALT